MYQRICKHQCNNFGECDGIDRWMWNPENRLALTLDINAPHSNARKKSYTVCLACYNSRLAIMSLEGISFEFIRAMYGVISKLFVIKSSSSSELLVYWNFKKREVGDNERLIEFIWRSMCIRLSNLYNFINTFRLEFYGFGWTSVKKHGNTIF